jgi:hypothetical protein
MKRYFSHYTIIYPALFLKNHITELDQENRLIRYYPYENEIRSTEFYSGLLIFTPLEHALDFSFIDDCWSKKEIDRLEAFFRMSEDKQPLGFDEKGLKIFHIP